MSRSLLHILFVMLCINSFAGQSKFEDAKKAYFEKKYDLAIDLLQSELKNTPNNPSIYFNLGLAYKADKKYPMAIWAFEKTLRLRPNDEEAIQLIDASYIEMDSELSWESNAGTFARNLYSLGSNMWSILAIIFSILAATFILLMRKTQSVTQRKVRLAGAIVCGTFLIISGFIASSTYNFEHQHDYAIVIGEGAPKKKDQDDESDKKKGKKPELQPGMKVKIISWNENGQSKIETPSGQKILVAKGLKRI